jgi:thiopurine S-methyltransferase
MFLNAKFWEQKYQSNKTGWDLGEVSPPIKEYIDQLTNKNLKILIPGGGNSYEAEYLFQKGFQNVFVVDVSRTALENFKNRVPNFPSSNLLNNDFFELKQDFDLIIEQTFFCAIDPILRPKYTAKIYEILRPKGKLVGLLFSVPLNEDHPPFGGSKEEYQSYFIPKFKVISFQECYNSFQSRQGMELFINLKKKN